MVSQTLAENSGSNNLRDSDVVDSVDSSAEDLSSDCSVEAADMLSVDQVSQMMREQDADLLESMHYAASQVSQYSPGGTPQLRPVDHPLPMDSGLPPMSIPMSASSHLSMRATDPVPPQSPSSVIRSASFNDLAHLGSRENSAHSTRQLAIPTLFQHGSSTLDACKPCPMDESWNGEEPDNEQVEDLPLGTATGRTAEFRLRRLLSGEVRSMDPIVGAPNGEEDTTASPVSVAHEAASTALEKQQKVQSGLAEQRRVQEALQFAEAVGETLSTNRDGLCIIEDHGEDGDSDDDDDGARGSKEIIVVEPEVVQHVVSIPPAPQEKRVIVSDEQCSEDPKQTTLPSHVDIPPTPEYVRRKTKRPMWPFGPAGSDYDRFLDNLSDGMIQSNFVYKGICANPPEITKHGIQRGNYAQLHRKAWLEVSDKYHRYGKNLRLYYLYWERLGFPTNQFFDWLDSKGEAAGQPLPNLSECPRSVLDSDTVLYITNPEVTEGYALEIVPNEEGRGRILDVDGVPVKTGPEGWIFVLRDNVMYGAPKITSISGLSKQRFHHSSFFGGKAVAAAGILISDDDGYLTRLYPHSGHYRPGEAHMQRMLFFLHRRGVDLRTVEMDTQQFRHVSRDKDAKSKDNEKKEKSKEGKDKMKKVESLHMEKAVNVACFLAHKASFIGNGIFDKIHRIRKADVTNVSEALDLVDDGGYWQQRRWAKQQNKE